VCGEVSNRQPLAPMNHYLSDMRRAQRATILGREHGALSRQAAFDDFLSNADKRCRPCSSILRPCGGQDPKPVLGVDFLGHHPANLTATGAGKKLETQNIGVRSLVIF
jgi:hypothetical protein